MSELDKAMAAAGYGLAHHFAEGLYAKEIRIPAGQEVMQHRHNFDHLSVLASGRVLLAVDGVSKVLQGPACVVITAGKSHKITSMTDAVWFCIHSTDCDDPEKVDAELIKGN